MQRVYCLAEDHGNGKLSEEQLCSELEAAGRQLDERQRGVAASLLSQKCVPAA